MTAVPQAPRIRKSARAKRLRLLVKPDGLELVVPGAMSEALALSFFERHRSWAEHKMAELAARTHPTEPFASGGSVPWQGGELPLLIRPGPRGRSGVELAETGMIITVGASACADAAKQALRVWVSRRMKDTVPGLMDRHAGRYGLYPRALRIKQMRTRWGSCGPRNDINLNWLLGLAPEAVLEYVVVHELCHIRERNHSRAFWSLVGEHLPDYAERRDWLRRQGSGLLRRF